MKNNKLSQEEYDILYNKFQETITIDDELIESKIYAYLEIWDSIEKVYNNIIPKILNETDNELLIDLIWDIREEFRHINYHIHDANLIEE